MKRAFAVCWVAVLVTITGCSSQPGAGPADPAALAPASTLAFASVQTDAIPGADLGAMFTKATRTSPSLDYDADVKPWLGDTLALVVTRAGIHDGDFAVLAESTDDDKARAAIEKDLTGSSPQSAAYRGVDYELLDGRFANGVVDHWLVAGTEAAFKAVVDASKDDDKSLLASDQWKQTVGTRGDGKEGLAFVDAKGLLQSFTSQLPGAGRVALPLLLGLLDLHPFVGTLDSQADKLVVDVSSPGTAPDPRGPAAASSDLIEALPAQAWFALAVPDVGPALGKLVEILQSNPLLAAPVAAYSRRFERMTGLDLQRDVIAAVGDVGAFALGAKARRLAGGVVIETTEPAALAKALKRLPRVARHKHKHGPLRILTTADRVVAAHGSAAAARQVLNPSARLGDTTLFATARAAIGERPTLLVDVPKALEAGAASPHHRKHRLKLQHVRYVAGGALRDDGLDVLRLVVGLR